MKDDWRSALLIVTFGLSLFGAAGAALSFIRWLGLGPPIRQLLAAISSLPPMELVIALVAFVGPLLLVAVAFAIPRRKEPRDVPPQ